MEALLRLLFERYDRSSALELLRDESQRASAMTALSADLELAGMPAGALSTTEGGNLFVAVLALRLKFPEDEALEKVQLNIAMREGRR